MNLFKCALGAAFAAILSIHIGTAYSQTPARKTAPPPDIGVTAIVPKGAKIRIFQDYGRPYPLSEAMKTRLNVPDYHHGVDFTRPYGIIAGADVLAASSGRVVLIRGKQCAGRAVAIESPHLANNGSLFVEYRHVGDIQVEIGQTVGRGEKIAVVEEDMQEFPCIYLPHLHLAVRTSLAQDIHADVTNPNLYWHDGPGKVTCLETAGKEPSDRLALTVPIKCQPD